MSKFRIWFGDEPQYISVSSVGDAIRVIKKNMDKFPEGEAGLEYNEDGVWDEWLDEDDQGIHEHLYMYGKTSRFLRLDSEDEEEEYDEEYDDDDDDDIEDDDINDRLLNVIGGGGSSNNEDFDDDDEFEEEDDDDDFDDEDDE